MQREKFEDIRHSFPSALRSLPAQDFYNGRRGSKFGPLVVSSPIPNPIPSFIIKLLRVIASKSSETETTSHILPLASP
jgi:hypothetical protein